MIPYTIKIDLDGQRDIYPDIALSVGDFGYSLILEFQKGGTLYDITGYNLAVYARRSGSSTPIPDVGKVENGKGYYVIKPSMYAYSGETQLEIVLTGTGLSQVVKVLHFAVRSGFSSLGNAVASEADYTVLSSLIQDAQTAIYSANAAATYANGIKQLGLQYVIAPSNAINKDRADLILTGANDETAINAAIVTLAAARASEDVAVRIDFMGGTINCGNPISSGVNFKLYFNGAKIVKTGSMFPGSMLAKASSLIDGGVFDDDIYCFESGAKITNCHMTADVIVDSGVCDTIIIGNRFVGGSVSDMGTHTIISGNAGLGV